MKKLVKIGRYAINPDYVVAGWPTHDGTEYCIRVIGDVFVFFGEAEVKLATKFIDKLCKTPRENFNG